MTTLDGGTVLDAHVTGSRVIVFDGAVVTAALVGARGEWLG